MCSPKAEEATKSTAITLCVTPHEIPAGTHMEHSSQWPVRPQGMDLLLEEPLMPEEPYRRQQESIWLRFCGLIWAYGGEAAKRWQMTFPDTANASSHLLGLSAQPGCSHTAPAVILDINLNWALLQVVCIWSEAGILWHTKVDLMKAWFKTAWYLPRIFHQIWAGTGPGSCCSRCIRLLFREHGWLTSTNSRLRVEGTGNSPVQSEDTESVGACALLQQPWVSTWECLYSQHAFP